jgi:hypothetical protein
MGVSEVERIKIVNFLGFCELDFFRVVRANDLVLSWKAFQSHRGKQLSGISRKRWDP